MADIDRLVLNGVEYRLSDSISNCAIRQGEIPALFLESGTYSDGDGTTKVANVTRIRNVSPISVDYFYDFTIPSGYQFFAFYLDKDLQFLGTSISWLEVGTYNLKTYLKKSNIIDRIKYINFTIRGAGRIDQDISGEVSTVQANCRLTVTESIIRELERTIDHEIRNTHFCYKGDSDTQRVINGNTGVDLTASNNFWCTKDFILVPEKEITIFSGTVGIGIVGYDSDMTYKGSIHAQEGLTSPITVFDNSIYKFKYIRLNMYNQSGYTSDKDDGVQIVYYLDDALESILDGYKYGNYTIMTDASGISSVEPSRETVGLKEFLYADRSVEITRNTDNDYTLCYIVVDGSGKRAYFEWNKYDDSGPISVTISKGSYYWFGVKKKDNSNIKIEDTIDAIKDHFVIKYLYDGEIGYGSFGDTGQILSTKRTRVCTPDKLYADSYVLLKADPGYVFSVVLYNNDDVPSFSHWRGGYSVTEYAVPEECYYRVTVGYANSNAIDVDKKELVYKHIKTYIAESSVERVRLQINALSELSARSLERINALEQASGKNVVPDYFVSHMQTKIALINGYKNDHDATQFAFITDTHVNGYAREGGRGNQLHSKALLTYLCRNTTVDKVFDGGDMYNSGTGLTNSEAIALIRKGADYSQPDANCRRYFVIGNHDTGYDWPGGVEYGPSVTQEQLYVNCGNDIHLSALSVDFKARSNFYFDEGDVRYIVSNFGLPGFTGESNGWSWGFVADALKSANGKKIVIFQHVIWQSYADSNPSYHGQALIDTVDAYNSRGVGSFEPNANATRDFSECTGKVVCIVAGHMHMDRSVLTSTGVPVVATTTDNAEGEAPETYSSRDNYIGTINEQAFDVFSLDFTNNKIYVTRIGFGNDRVFNIPAII